ncbi:Vitamin K epoxide reductase complex subunit 1-like protein 1 [Pteropus alecto]|uniref:vitamin-K-epoxide reductase (warfarin-sensitive) n=1 Tax=Pteropus alecto TaxID=9402 RepID=L5K530_PTEAL|nr:Vitamin K epoxide reductase complex subunit 1-like protein 1 [Pteropus alecto]
MGAPVLLRVSVPRWERVARYAVCAAGILLSIYAYHVEREKERDPEHRALCDLGPWVKCSAALTSRYPHWGGSGPGMAKRSEGGGWGWGARSGSSGLGVGEDPAAEGPTAL